MRSIHSDPMYHSMGQNASPCELRGERTQPAIGVWQNRIDHGCADVVAHLALGEQEDDRTTGPVADGVQLGVQAAFRATNTPRSIPPFSDLRQSGGL